MWDLSLNKTFFIKRFISYGWGMSEPVLGADRCPLVKWLSLLSKPREASISQPRKSIKWGQLTNEHIYYFAWLPHLCTAVLWGTGRGTLCEGFSDWNNRRFWTWRRRWRSDRFSCLPHVADNTSKPGISGAPVSCSACGDRQAYTPHTLNTEESKMCHLNVIIFFSQVHLGRLRFVSLFLSRTYNTYANYIRLFILRQSSNVYLLSCVYYVEFPAQLETAM